MDMENTITDQYQSIISHLSNEEYYLKTKKISQDINLPVAITNQNLDGEGQVVINNNKKNRFSSSKSDQMIFTIYAVISEYGNLQTYYPQGEAREQLFQSGLILQWLCATGAPLSPFIYFYLESLQNKISNSQSILLNSIKSSYGWELYKRHYNRDIYIIRNFAVALHEQDVIILNILDEKTGQQVFSGHVYPEFSVLNADYRTNKWIKQWLKVAELSEMKGGFGYNPLFMASIIPEKSGSHIFDIYYALDYNTMREIDEMRPNIYKGFAQCMKKPLSEAV